MWDTALRRDPVKALMNTDPARDIQQQNDQKEFPFNISKFKDFINTSWIITVTYLTLTTVLTVSVTWLNFFLRITTNTTAAEHEQL